MFSSAGLTWTKPLILIQTLSEINSAEVNGNSFESTRVAVRIGSD